MSRVHGFLGIDSSLKQNVACLRINDRTYRSAFDNDQNGHAALIAWAMKFAPQGPTIGVEATGNYHKDLAWAIRSQGLTCLVLNPRQVRDLAKGLGVCKTDKTDAEVISRVLEVPKISCQAQRSKVHDELRDISREIQSLTELKSDLQRRLKGPCRSNAAKQADAALIAVCKAQIARLEREWMRIVKTTDVLHESYKLQLGIPCIGPKTARVAVSEFPEQLSGFSVKEACSYGGLVPWLDESGERKRPAHIRGGNARLRQALFMPALTASSKDTQCKDLYARLRAKGSTHKRALTAVMHKLLRRSASVLRRHTAWRPEVDIC